MKNHCASHLHTQLSSLSNDQGYSCSTWHSTPASTGHLRLWGLAALERLSRTFLHLPHTSLIVVSLAGFGANFTALVIDRHASGNFEDHTCPCCRERQQTQACQQARFGHWLGMLALTFLGAQRGPYCNGQNGLRHDLHGRAYKKK